MARNLIVVVRLCILFLLPEADGYDFPSTGNSQGDRILETLLLSQ
jgi:hypothetical protein